MAVVLHAKGRKKTVIDRATLFDPGLSVMNWFSRSKSRGRVGWYVDDENYVLKQQMP